MYVRPWWNYVVRVRCVDYMTIKRSFDFIVSARTQRAKAPLQSSSLSHLPPLCKPHLALLARCIFSILPLPAPASTISCAVQLLLSDQTASVRLFHHASSSSRDDDDNDEALLLLPRPAVTLLYGRYSTLRVWWIRACLLGVRRRSLMVTGRVRGGKAPPPASNAA